MLRRMRNDAALRHEGSNQLGRLFLDLVAESECSVLVGPGERNALEQSLIPRGRGWRPSTMASAGAPRAPSCLGLGRRGLSFLRSLHDGVSCARLLWQERRFLLLVQPNTRP